MHQEDNLRDALERLVHLGQMPDVDLRAVLLRVLVDLFVYRDSHSAKDLKQFEDLIQRLLDDADGEVRRVVAEKLAPHPATPRGLLDRFLAEGGEIALPVLRDAPVPEHTLVSAALCGSGATALAVSGRPDLSAAIVAILADRPEPAVLLTLARNGSAPIDRAVYRHLVRRARGDEALGSALLAREGHPADRAPLFLLANSEQRSAIVLAARREDLSPTSFRPRLNAEETAALTRVERAILLPDRDGFDSALASALGIGLEETWRLIDDAKGEALALALAAIGASPEVAARVFILSGPAIGHSVMKVRSLTVLVEAMPRRTAARLVRDMTQAVVSAPRLQARSPDPVTRAEREPDGRSLARAPETFRASGSPVRRVQTS